MKKFSKDMLKLPATFFILCTTIKAKENKKFKLKPQTFAWENQVGPLPGSLLSFQSTKPQKTQSGNLTKGFLINESYKLE